MERNLTLIMEDEIAAKIDRICELGGITLNGFLIIALENLIFESIDTIMAYMGAYKEGEFPALMLAIAAMDVSKIHLLSLFLDDGGTVNVENQTD